MSNLYLLTQTANGGYDTYDSAVVCADSEEEATRIEVGTTGMYGSWVKPKDVEAELIGVASKSVKKGEVICASFNAG